MRPVLAYAAIPGALALIALGLVFMMQLHFLLGILAFRFVDVWMFMMVKDNLLLLATGAMVPLFLMPDWLQAALRFLPFYSVTYLPSMVLMGRLWDEAPYGVAVPDRVERGDGDDQPCRVRRIARSLRRGERMKKGFSLIWMMAKMPPESRDDVSA